MHAPRPLRALALLLVALPLLAGCVSDGGVGVDAEVRREASGRPTTAPSASEYWFVWVRGEEQWGSSFGTGVCDVAEDHTIDEGRQQVLYYRETYSFDRTAIESLVAFDVWERPSDCPAAYRLVPDARGAEVRIGRLGDVAFTVFDDGSVAVGDETVAPGERAVFTYQREFEADGSTHDVSGRFTVETVGAWPRTGLVAR